MMNIVSDTLCVQKRCILAVHFLRFVTYLARNEMHIRVFIQEIGCIMASISREGWYDMMRYDRYHRQNRLQSLHIEEEQMALQMYNRSERD